VRQVPPDESLHRPDARVDPRSPAGNDRVAVLVLPAGWLGSSRIEVMALDTTSS
jgi:hypothetical protein